jgi:Mg2+ and Co2+ transporter CorA
MRAFTKNNNGLIATTDWTPNCWIIECPTEAEKKYLLEELQIPEAFYNDIEDIDERPRIEIENGWTLIIMRIRSDEVALLPKCCLKLYALSNKCMILCQCAKYQDNFDLLKASSVFGFKAQCQKKIKLAEDLKIARTKKVCAREMQNAFMT